MPTRMPINTNANSRTARSARTSSLVLQSQKVERKSALGSICSHINDKLHRSHKVLGRFKPGKQKCPLLAWVDWENEQQVHRRRRNGKSHYKKRAIDNHKFDPKYTYLWCQIFCSACKRSRLEFWYQSGRLYSIIHWCTFRYYVRPR